LKKIILQLIIFSINEIVVGQDLINPYLDYNGKPTIDLQYNSALGTMGYDFNKLTGSGTYNGEYEFLLDDFPWGDPSMIAGAPSNPLFNLNNYALSYKIELVSFPFTVDCQFPSDQNFSGGCTGMPNRIFNMPNDLLISGNNNDFWLYPDPTSGNNPLVTSKLWNTTPLKEFDRQPSAHTISDPNHNNVLVSAGFGAVSGATIQHTVLPHSVLKHTINIHCGPDFTLNPIISSFSFYVDLTRGRLREYPFRSNNPTSGNPTDHDLIIRPELIVTPSGFYDSNVFSNCNYSKLFPGGKCEDGVTVDDLDGFSINYTPFDPTSDDCSFIAANQNANFGDLFFNGMLGTGDIFRLPLADYSIIASTSVRNFNGTTLAGYSNFTGHGTMTRLYNSPITHNYTIDKNITIDWINPTEKIIFNPSEVYITANDLHFPSHYTFKTIRGTYPYKSEVDEAENDPNNGGPFNDPTKRSVPVKTDLRKDFHISNVYDPTNSDFRFASIYHLENGSKLTIEPCVKIFDATFEINPGSEIVFENWSTNQINVNRYQLLFEGGTVTKRNELFLFQNETETKRILHWEGGDYIAAGTSVDINNPFGEYILEPNSHINFTATNYIDLQPGFYAKNGSEFEASVKPVSIPSCPPFRLRSPQYSKPIDSKNPENKGLFTVTPNPVTENSYFIFEVNIESNAEIEIYNALGKPVFKITGESRLPIGKYNYIFNTVGLMPGLYIAKLTTINSQQSIKFIKQ
jgi:hypothetical protein